MQEPTTLFAAIATPIPVDVSVHPIYPAPGSERRTCPADQQAPISLAFSNGPTDGDSDMRVRCVVVRLPLVDANVNDGLDTRVFLQIGLQRGLVFASGVVAPHDDGVAGRHDEVEVFGLLGVVEVIA